GVEAPHLSARLLQARRQARERRPLGHEMVLDVLVVTLRAKAHLLAQPDLVPEHGMGGPRHAAERDGPPRREDARGIAPVVDADDFLVIDARREAGLLASALPVHP